jgi:hypothetical protein
MFPEIVILSKKPRKHNDAVANSMARLKDLWIMPGYTGFQQVKQSLSTNLEFKFQKESQMISTYTRKMGTIYERGC